MRLPAEPIRSLSRSRLAFVLAIPFFAAGCSSESTRFGEGALLQSVPSPRNSAPETTGSISQRPAPAPQVESRPLPQAGRISRSRNTSQQPPYQPRRSAVPIVVSAERGAAADHGRAFHNNRNASYQPAGAPAPDYTGSVRTPPQAQQAPVPRQAPPANSSNWQWEGGTAVTVGQGETLDSLANRYGVPGIGDRAVEQSRRRTRRSIRVSASSFRNTIMPVRLLQRRPPRRRLTHRLRRPRRVQPSTPPAIAPHRSRPRSKVRRISSSRAKR